MKKREQYQPPVYIGQNLYIKPSYIVSIPEFYKENDSRSLAELKNEENLLDNDQNGKLSRKAITNLRNSINWLCLAAKKKWVYNKELQKWFYFKVNFVTLTLPDTDEPIGSEDLQKKLLNPFLTYMRKYHGLKNYVWRLEFQANGKLHVHLTSDSFLHLGAIRDTWNRLMDKHGYLDKFYKENNHKDPNSTDVHSTRKIKNLAGYLAKYMSKQGSTPQYPLKMIQDKIDQSLLIGVNEKTISAMVRKKEILKKSKVKPLGVMDWKAWYVQRINFWNSTFNPRPITGRLWGCSKALSQANKTSLHIPNGEGIAQDLKCLMQSDIRYEEIFSKAPETIHSQFAPQDWRNQPRKIGEIYFLTAVDWFKKMNGVIRQKFDEVRGSITHQVTHYTLELG